MLNHCHYKCHHWLHYTAWYDFLLAHHGVRRGGFLCNEVELPQCPTALPNLWPIEIRLFFLSNIIASVWKAMLYKCLVGKVPDMSWMSQLVLILMGTWPFCGTLTLLPPLSHVSRACPWVWVITIIRDRITVISHVLTSFFSASGTPFWGHVLRVPTRVPRVSQKKRKVGTTNPGHSQPSINVYVGTQHEFWGLKICVFPTCHVTRRRHYQHRSKMNRKDYLRN